MFEVENLGRLSFTEQVRELASDRQLVLFIRQDTQLSKPLQTAIERGEILVRHIPE